MTQAAIIFEMRQALELLKRKYVEAVGSWVMADFLEAATSGEDHWMHQVVKAEKLSKSLLAALPTRFRLLALRDAGRGRATYQSRLLLGRHTSLGHARSSGRED